MTDDKIAAVIAEPTKDDLINRLALLLGVPILPSAWHQLKATVDALEALTGKHEEARLLLSTRVEASRLDEALTANTEDEREALAKVIEPELPYSTIPTHDDALDVADAILAAGFRRQTVPVEGDVTVEWGVVAVDGHITECSPADIDLYRQAEGSEFIRTRTRTSTVTPWKEESA